MLEELQLIQNSATNEFIICDLNYTTIYAWQKQKNLKI